MTLPGPYLLHAEWCLERLRALELQYTGGGHKATLTPSVFLEEWPQIALAQSRIASHTPRDSRGDELASDYAAAAPTLLEVYQHPSEQLKWLLVAIEAADVRGLETHIPAHKNHLGSVYARLGDPSRAIEYYEEALRAGAASNSHDVEAAALGNLASMHSWRGEFATAIQYYERQIALCAHTKNHQHEAAAWINLGSVFTLRDESLLAYRCYRRVIRIARRLDEWRLRAQALSGLGGICTRLHHRRRAIVCLQGAIELFRAVHDDDGLANALGHLAEYHGSGGAYDQAEKCYDQAVDMLRKCGNSRALAHMLCQRATVLSEAGMADRSAGVHRDALEEFVRLGDAAGEGKALAGLGEDLLRMGHYEECLPHLEEALAIHRKHENRYFEGRILNNMSIAYIHADRPQQACVLSEKAVEVSRLGDDGYNEARSLGTWGNALAMNGDYEGAKRCYAESLRISDTRNEPSGGLATLVNLSILHYENDNPLEAVKTCEQAMPIAYRLGDHEKGALLSRLHRQAACRALQKVQAILKSQRDMTSGEETGSPAESVG